MRPPQGGGAGPAEAKVTGSPAGRVLASLFAHWGFLLGRLLPANPGTRWDAHLLRQTWHYSLSSKHPGGLDSFFHEAGREFGKRMAVVAANPRPRHGRCPISRTGGDKMMGNHSPLSPRGRAVAPGSPVQTPGQSAPWLFPRGPWYCDPFFGPLSRYQARF